MGAARTCSTTAVRTSRRQPFLPVNNGWCGRLRDHRQVIDRVLHRVRTGIQWRDLSDRLGPWKSVEERHDRSTA
ncbi:transposase [Streptomyces sp. NPDC057486]|uniref:transposase n=1 Tax=Streptomyces sp. NPDC057486 TaxID=3346145 RepID=UPI00367F6EC9